MGLVVSWCLWLSASVEARFEQYHPMYQWVCAYGTARDVRALLENPRADPNEGDQRLVEWAARRGNAEVLRELITCDRVSSDANKYALEEAFYAKKTRLHPVIAWRSQVQCT
jgi:hypothetical protein